jgi:hypothetical protein
MMMRVQTPRIRFGSDAKGQDLGPGKGVMSTAGEESSSSGAGDDDSASSFGERSNRLCHPSRRKAILGAVTSRWSVS